MMLLGVHILFINNTSTTVIYTSLLVGSVRCVEKTDLKHLGVR